LITAGVVGVTGRLGHAILKRLEHNGIRVVLTASGTDGWHGQEVPDVLVDASGPGAWEAVAGYCRRNRIPLLECVSDLDPGAVAGLAEQVPVLHATNLALGHHVQRKLITRLAQLLGDTGEATVWERHPSTKAHRPSATAVLLAQEWGGRVGEIASRRSGLAVSEHELTVTLAGETVSIRHEVGDLAAAAAGAVLAVCWLPGRSAGRYSMSAVYESKDWTDEHDTADRAGGLRGADAVAGRARRLQPGADLGPAAGHGHVPDQERVVWLRRGDA